MIRRCLHRPAPRALAVGLGLALLALAVPAAAGSSAGAAAAVAAQDDAAALAAGLRALNAFATASQEALALGDTAAARAAYGQFDQGWDAIEDGVRERSRAAYRDIEDAMREVYRLLNTEPVDAAAASAQLDQLKARVDAFIATLQVG